MSDSSELKAIFAGPWMKLYAFSNLRMVLGGAWISTPKFWFEAITKDNIDIKMSIFEEYGGGRLDSFSIEVKSRWASSEMFAVKLRYDDRDFSTFGRRMNDMYSYMNSYASGKTWYGRAMCDRFKEDFGFDPREWNRIFGPLKNIDRVAPSYFEKMNELLPSDGFQLLEAVNNLLNEKEISVCGNTAENIQFAKEWSLMTLLDMERYHYTCC